MWDAIKNNNWNHHSVSGLTQQEAAAVSEFSDGMFSGNTTTIKNFDELRFFKGLTSIPSRLFNNSTTLETITIPENVTNLGLASFAITGADYKTGTRSKLKTIKGLKNVLTTENSVFQYTTNLEDITFGKLKVLGQAAFLGSSIKHVYGVENVDTIGKGPFQNAVNLETVDFSNKVTLFDDGTFNACRNLISVGDASNVTGIGRIGFQNCNKLEYINLTDKCLKIGDDGFNQCHSMRSVGDVSNVTSIGLAGFQHNHVLTKLNLSNKCKSIGEYCFFGCFELESVGDLGGLTDIPTYAFTHCYKLKELGDTSNVKTIGYASFAYSSAFTHFDFSSAVEIGQYAFDNARALTGVIDLPKCEKIGIGVFLECYAIEDFKLSNNLKVISSFAFDHCSGVTAKTVTIPASLVEIGASHAWYNFGKSGKDYFSRFIVEDGNKNFKIDEYGILYTIDGKKSCFYPT